MSHEYVGCRAIPMSSAVVGWGTLGVAHEYLNAQLKV